MTFMHNTAFCTTLKHPFGLSFASCHQVHCLARAGSGGLAFPHRLSPPLIELQRLLAVLSRFFPALNFICVLHMEDNAVNKGTYAMENILAVLQCTIITMHPAA